VCFYSAYPVAKSWDLADLYNKNNYDSHDTHYVPTVRKPLPKDVYDALKSSPGAYRSIPDDPKKERNYPLDTADATPTADEFVVFDPSQILLSYRIETQPGQKDAKDFLRAIQATEEKPSDDTLWKGLELQDITLSKLKDPARVLSVTESIDVMYDCIQAGEQRAEEAEGRDIIIFLGNTGAGKSTTINYLAGCEMEYIDREDVGMQGEGEIARVKASSPKKALMQIGYTN